MKENETSIVALYVSKFNIINDLKQKKLSTDCRMVKYRPQDVSVRTTGWAGTDDLDVQKNARKSNISMVWAYFHFVLKRQT